jgi:hypothetical protein
VGVTAGWHQQNEVEAPTGLRHFEVCEDFGGLMDPGRAAPPAAERCLVLSYASRGQKGGTLIDESVMDLAEHETRMRDPASYRPKECRCGGRTLHVHGRRERRMRGSATADGGLGTVTVMVFLCVLPARVRELT